MRANAPGRKWGFAPVASAIAIAIDHRSLTMKSGFFTPPPEAAAMATPAGSVRTTYMPINLKGLLLLKR